MKIEPMKYHYPGWSLTVTRKEYGREVHYDYKVWAPRTQEDVDRMGGVQSTREGWAANISAGYIEDEEYHDLDSLLGQLVGGHWRGDSFAEVTKQFPAHIRTAFARVVPKVKR